MSMTVKHLNADASFLLTFQPLLSISPPPGHSPNTFTVVLDPWLAGPSKVFHSKFAISRHKAKSCITSLNELPEVDLIVISQDKSDHCHKETLTQLPRSGGKTLILAEQSAAKVIRSWKHFAPEKVITLPKFEDARSRKPSNIYRIPISSFSPNARPGEVTITLLAQKPDLTRVHTAIGITYRPPHNIEYSLEMTPPATPKSQSFSNEYKEPSLSVIHAPHGCTYKTIEGYATTHLVEKHALPLTALLHCFDRISNAWYLGGNVCSGMPGGQKIAQSLCAKVWISAHDGEKELRGVANKKLVVQKFMREQVEDAIKPHFPKVASKRSSTRAVVLNIGEEIRLSNPEDDDESEKQAKMRRLSRFDFLNQEPSPMDSGKHVNLCQLILHDKTPHPDPFPVESEKQVKLGRFLVHSKVLQPELSPAESKMQMAMSMSMGSLRHPISPPISPSASIDRRYSM